MKKTLIFLFFLLFCFFSCSVKYTKNPLPITSQADADFSTSRDVDSDTSKTTELSNDSKPSNDSSDTESSDVSEEFIEPPTNICIDKYTFFSQSQGKTIANIFSSADIYDITSRKQNGEIFSLTSQEIDFIIENTIKLFQEYDYVRITDINNNEHFYYGLSFYSSSEYFACFNKLVAISDPKSTFNLDGDIYEVIYMRIATLSSSVCESINISGSATGFKLILSNSNSLSNGTDIDKLAQDIFLTYYAERPFPDTLIGYSCAAYMFHEECIYRVKNISSANSNPLERIFPTEKFARTGGKYEYGNNGHSIVAEIYEEMSQSVIARIRIDESHLVEIVEELWNETNNNRGGNSYENTFKTSDYRIIVYLNGLGKSFYYKFDEKSDEWSAMTSENFAANAFFSTGCSKLGIFINTFIDDTLGAFYIK